MSAFVAESPRRGKGSSDLPELLTFAWSGMILGAAALMFYALAGALLMAFVQNLTGVTDSGEALPKGGPEISGVVAVLLSIVIGVWLYRQRLSIGKQDDPRHAELVQRRRRYFTVGAMLVYVPLSPALWLFFVAVANTTS